MATTHARTTPASTGLLWGLTALFALRVFAQALQYWAPIDSLPDVAAFQGSNLPYPVLLSSQLLILLLMCRGAWLAAADWSGPMEPVIARSWPAASIWQGPSRASVSVY